MTVIFLAVDYGFCNDVTLVLQIGLLTDLNAVVLRMNYSTNASCCVPVDCFAFPVGGR